MDIATELKRQREARGLSRATLGERSKVSPDSIRKIELGLTNPTPATLSLLEAGLGLPRGYFLQPDTSLKPVRQRLVFEVDLPNDTHLPDTSIPIIRDIAVALVQHIALIVNEVSRGSHENKKSDSTEQGV